MVNISKENNLNVSIFILVHLKIDVNFELKPRFVLTQTWKHFDFVPKVKNASPQTIIKTVP